MTANDVKQPAVKFAQGFLVSLLASFCDWLGSGALAMLTLFALFAGRSDSLHDFDRTVLLGSIVALPKVVGLGFAASVTYFFTRRVPLPLLTFFAAGAVASYLLNPLVYWISKNDMPRHELAFWALQCLFVAALLLPWARQRFKPTQVLVFGLTVTLLADLYPLFFIRPITTTLLNFTETGILLGLCWAARQMSQAPRLTPSVPNLNG